MPALHCVQGLKAPQARTYFHDLWREWKRLREKAFGAEKCDLSA
jgi:hypothetical protein